MYKSMLLKCYIGRVADFRSYRAEFFVLSLNTELLYAKVSFRQKFRLFFFPSSRRNNGMLIVCHYVSHFTVLHSSIFLCAILLFTFYLYLGGGQMVRHRYKKIENLIFFIYYIEPEFSVIDCCLLTPRWLRENVYYVKNGKIYCITDRCLGIRKDGLISISKKRELLSMTVISAFIFCI